MTLSIIAALADNNAIGRNNGLPWHLPTDLKRFKALTMGHHVIMGRKTYDSIGKPLPGRTNIVVTRGTVNPDGIAIARSIDEALAHVPAGEVFIAGGGEIFQQTIHRADRMYLTRVHTEVLDADAFFPEFDDVSEWRLDDSEHFDADEKNEFPFSFLMYVRITPELLREPG